MQCSAVGTVYVWCFLLVPPSAPYRGPPPKLRPRAHGNLQRSASRLTVVHCTGWQVVHHVRYVSAAHAQPKYSTPHYTRANKKEKVRTLQALYNTKRGGRCSVLGYRRDAENEKAVSCAHESRIRRNHYFALRADLPPPGGTVNHPEGLLHVVGYDMSFEAPCKKIRHPSVLAPCGRGHPFAVHVRRT